MARSAGVSAERSIVASLRFGLVEPPDQDEAPRLEIARMGGVRAVAMGFEDRRCGGERLGGTGEVARRERDLGLDDDAPRARHGLPRAEGAGGPPHQRLRAVEVAELGHGDAAQRERRRVLAQRHPVQRAERIAHGERAGRCRDQRVHVSESIEIPPHEIPSHLSLPGGPSSILV